MSASAGKQDLDYLYASIVNVSNFVSVKLSGTNNYHVWKSQMLCLLDSNNMGGIVDAKFVGPTYSGKDAIRQYDSLARGWILGSVSEDVLADVHDLVFAKSVWDKLKALCDPAMRLQEDSTLKKSDVEAEIEVHIDDVSADTNTGVKGHVISMDIAVDEFRFTLEKHMLLIHTQSGEWSNAEFLLELNKGLVTEAIDGDGSTILHIASGTSHIDFVRKLLRYINKDGPLLQQRVSDGSTALHVAAIVGNTDAADLLVKRNQRLLFIKDKKGDVPLQKAYEYMHFDTIEYLLKAVRKNGKTELQSSSVHPADDNVVSFIVNAISAKQYSVALEWVREFPNFASKSDEVLMALAKTFPSELAYWESLIYPSFDLEDFFFDLIKLAENILKLMGYPAFILWKFTVNRSLSSNVIRTTLFQLVIPTVPAWLASAFGFIWFLMLAIRFIFICFYSLCRKGAKILLAPIKRIDKKQKECEAAAKVLSYVCRGINKLNKSGSDHPYYTRPILEAACHNAYKVVNYILYKSPKAIQSTNESGYDLIQLAILNRSENIYNLIYDIGERKNNYRIYNDSYKNNILHLAGKLAPSSVLNQRTGAALQLQRELQWYEEVKKLVFPAYLTQENIFGETPDMVFTMEHKDLVKEGEQWMKTTAESCSITAALITTIVFAAAITVPGGSNQEKGTPLFQKESAFIIFAISDAISLFASSTALLVFLSILTARFAEKDFLVSLPRRLFIGLFSLVISTTTMMIAFSATLYLVFCDKKPLMLLPIIGLAFIPITTFVALQFPLMVDLFRWTYIPIFGKLKRENYLLFRIQVTLAETLEKIFWS